MLVNNSEKAALRMLHRKWIIPLVALKITHFKEQRRFAVTGPMMVSMVLMVKIHKKKFQVGLTFLRLMTHPIRYARSSPTY